MVVTRGITVQVRAGIDDDSPFEDTSLLDDHLQVLVRALGVCVCVLACVLALSVRVCVCVCMCVCVQNPAVASAGV